MRSALVAPPERRSSSRNLAVLLPSRLLGAFFRDLADFAAHSVRGFISGVLGKKIGLKVASTKVEDGERRYSLKS